jgi:hypothetical protein
MRHFVGTVTGDTVSDSIPLPVVSPPSARTTHPRVLICLKLAIGNHATSVQALRVVTEARRDIARSGPHRPDR